MRVHHTPKTPAHRFDTDTRIMEYGFLRSRGTRDGRCGLRGMAEMWLLYCALGAATVAALAEPLGGAETCAEGAESTTLQLGCSAGTGAIITGVDFAQYGLVSGSCPSSLAKGRCDADITGPVRRACIGQSSCTVMCSHSCCPSPNCCGCVLTSGTNTTKLFADVPDPIWGASKSQGVKVTCNSSLPELELEMDNTTVATSLEANSLAAPNVSPVDGPAAAAAAAKAHNVNVSYFSWYSYTGCDEGLLPEPGCQRNLSASPSAAYRNLAMDGDLGFLKRTHDRFSIPGMLDLQNSNLPGCNHSKVYSSQTGLTPGWEAAVDSCIAMLVPLARGNGGHIHGVQLGDELVCGSVPHFSFANLSALAARLHDGLHPHGVFIFTNECAGTPAEWPEIPRGLDVISVDAYSSGACEVATAMQFYQRFLPMLKPHQSVWVVPGLFGPNATHANATRANTTAMAENDESLVEKLSAYWEWADQEPKITGMIPWHWANLGANFEPAGLQLGGDSFPETLGWIADKVAELAPHAAAA